MLGVDEAGRVPLAGPVAVGGDCRTGEFLITREFPGLADSKQMSRAYSKNENVSTFAEAYAGRGHPMVRGTTSAERIDVGD